MSPVRSRSPAPHSSLSDCSVWKVVCEDLAEARSISRHRTSTLLAQTETVTRTSALEDQRVTFPFYFIVIPRHNVPSHLTAQHQSIVLGAGSRQCFRFRGGQMGLPVLCVALAVGVFDGVIGIGVGVDPDFPQGTCASAAVRGKHRGN